MRAWIAALFCIALVVTQPTMRANAGEAVSFGITSITALSLPHYLAEEKKLYQAENLAVDTIVAGAAAGVLQQVAAGALNIAQVATDQTLRAILHGAPMKIVAGAISNAPFRLIGARQIKGWNDLKGKTISVGGVNDVTLYFLRIMARRNGLSDQDYDIVYGGGTPNRFAQLASGAVAAAILTNPIDFTALSQGYVDLGSVPQYLPNWAQNNLVIETRWGSQHRPAVLGFLRAQIVATRYFYDPANRAEVIDILARRTKSTLQEAAATYELYVREHVIALDAALFPDGIKANLDAFVEMGEIKQAPPLAGFIDAGFLAEALGSK
jgi:ABC-type nitrate/sulfonate/bicarbonate transport system substrate-binding protein